MQRAFSYLTLLVLAGAVMSGCQLSLPANQGFEQTPDSVRGSQEEAGTEETGARGDTTRVEFNSHQEQSGSSGTSTSSQRTEIAITQGEYFLTPNAITVSRATELVLKVTNQAGAHDFVINELGVDTGIIYPGETVAVAVPTTQPGTYTYYCSVGEHRELGMQGTLTIE